MYNKLWEELSKYKNIKELGYDEEILTAIYINLPVREQIILECKLGRGETFKQIGKRLDLTGSKICEVYRKTLCMFKRRYPGYRREFNKVQEDVSIWLLGMNARTTLALTREDICMLDELVCNTEEELLHIKDIGDSEVREIKEALLNRGLFLQGDQDTYEKYLKPSYNYFWHEVWGGEENSTLSEEQVVTVRDFIARIPTFIFIRLEPKYAALSYKEREFLDNVVSPAVQKLIQALDDIRS